MRFVRVPRGLRELGKRPLRELQEELLPQPQEPRQKALSFSLVLSLSLSLSFFRQGCGQGRTLSLSLSLSPLLEQEAPAFPLGAHRPRSASLWRLPAWHASSHCLMEVLNQAIFWEALPCRTEAETTTRMRPAYLRGTSA